jgi:hypothetical protein
MLQGIADGDRQLALGRDPRQGGFEPGLELLEQWPGSVGAPHVADLGRAAAQPVLDLVERRDALQRGGGKRRAGGGVEVEELAPHMRPARHLAHSVLPIELVEPGIAVGLQDAVEAGEMAQRVLGAAVRAVAVEGRRRGRATPGPVVAHIDPQPPGLGPAGTRCQNRHGGVVAMDLVGRQHMAGDRVDQRPQRPGRLANPAGERRPAEINPAAGEDLGLAIERQVRAVLVDQKMGEQPGARPAAVDRQVW